MNSHIPRSLSSRERKEQTALRNAISVSMDCYMMITMLSLNSAFGFGAERISRFVRAWQKTADTYADRYDDAVLTALKQRVKDNIGIDFESK